MAFAYEELALSNPHSIAQPGGSAFAHQDASARVPHEALGKLFLRFFRFEFLAWGGPAAQIAMIRQELVTEEKWVTPQHFTVFCIAR
jgi:Chromate transporter